MLFCVGATGINVQKEFFLFKMMNYNPLEIIWKQRLQLQMRSFQIECVVTLGQLHVPSCPGFRNKRTARLTNAGVIFLAP